ncbi:MAG: hypothetical protein OCD02_21005 [Spirochaetaceae bacterium]
MRKIIAILLICSTFYSFSETDIDIDTPEPYELNEFHPILLDVRRASIIFCGAFPLGYMYSSLIIDPLLEDSTIYDDLDTDEKSNKEIETKLISSLIFAGIIMIIDLIIEKFFRR